MKTKSDHTKQPKKRKKVSQAAVPANHTVDQLYKSEQLYRTIFHHSPLGIMHFDQQGIIVECNEKFLEIIGATYENVIGFDLPGRIKNEGMKAAVHAVLSGGSGFFEGEYQPITGSKLVFVRVSFSRLTSEDGAFLCGLCMIEDVSEQKKAEQECRDSEARYRAIVEDQTELILRFTPNGSLTFANEAYCRYFGEKAEELLGHKFWHHVPKNDQQKLREHLAKIDKKNQVAVIEHQVYSAAGEIRWQQWTDRAIFDELGNIVEFQAVGRDITERRNAEEALQESERQLRHLSAKILQAQEQERQRIALDLHDSVIQALATIKVSLGVSLKRLKRKEIERDLRPFESILAMIQDTIDEVRAVCSDLRPSMLDNLGILATISWACQEFGAAHNSIRVRVNTDIQESEIPENLKIVIYRILQEALNNAAKHSQAELVDVSLRIDQEAIRMVVEDNGCGFEMDQVLSAENHPHGLGLIGMRERTELSDGIFSIESAKECGTTIRAVWLLDHLVRG